MNGSDQRQVLYIHDKEAGRALLSTARGTVITAIASIFALFATLYVGVIAVKGAHDASVRSDRLSAYSDYLSALTEWEQYIWSNLFWSGTNGDRSGIDLDAIYWGPGIQLQARIESTYSRTRMLAGSTEVSDSLTSLRNAQFETQKRFACMSGLLIADCLVHGVDVLPTSQDAVTEMLTTWVNETEPLEQDVLRLGASQMNDLDLWPFDG